MFVTCQQQPYREKKNQTESRISKNNVKKLNINTSTDTLYLHQTRILSTKDLTRGLKIPNGFAKYSLGNQFMRENTLSI